MFLQECDSDLSTQLVLGLLFSDIELIVIFKLIACGNYVFQDHS